MHAEGNFKQPPEPPQPKAGPSCCLDLGPHHFDARDRRLLLALGSRSGGGRGTTVINHQHESARARTLRACPLPREAKQSSEATKVGETVTDLLLISRGRRM